MMLFNSKKSCVHQYSVTCWFL